jgi:hypothetical protein
MKRLKLLVPLLVFYLVIIVLFSSDELASDEPVFLDYARNLSHGFYSPKDDISLVKPPGYPVFLLPFIVLNLPLIIPKLLNAVLLFLSIFYFDKTLLLYMGQKKAAVFSYLLGVYPPFLPYIPLLITESLSLFLLGGFVFYFCRLNKSKQQHWHQLFIPALLLSLLAMTKLIFGYVILAGVIFFIILHVFFRAKNSFKSLLVFLVALLFCIPYLVYTFTLTGKVFYWGTNGGDMLYWMTTPYPNEYGDWHTEIDVLDQRNSPELYTNHGELFEKLSSLSSVEKDRILKRKAFENIKRHPAKYVQNWLANLGRMIFNYPYSYRQQTLPKYLYIIPNAFLLVIGVLCLYPSWAGRRLIPNEIKYALVFALIYSGGNSLVSAYPNYFIIIVPIFFLWIASVADRIIKFKIRR